VEQLRHRIEQLSDGLGITYEVAHARAREEADAAAVFQVKRAQQISQRASTKLASAYVLNDHDADIDIRYLSHLEREFDRTLKQLETVQSARNGIESPRIRLEVDDIRG